MLDSLKKLRDLDNTVIVVEHDKDMIKNSDFIVDLGPEAGVNGGEIIAEGDSSTIVGNKEARKFYLGETFKV